MPRPTPKSNPAYNKQLTSPAMEDFGSFDVPSPSGSLYYVYGDTDQYLESHTSESQSPNSSLYDMAPGTDFASVSHVYPSPERDEEEESQPSQQQKPAAKRKRENRYKNAPPSVLSRRRAQNRASQRAYRERKDQRIKDLEQMLNEAKQRNDVLGQAYATLHAEYLALKAAQLKEQGYQTDLAYGSAMGMSASGDNVDYSEFVYSDMPASYTL
ncbi:AP-1-like transcription factor YAP1 [Echria macrotheca]|uniref:Putative transcription factor kapC n=1 Tax=Echria macrotheca TaxID=438768 RepID=A0AAJ0BET5_9PEZI|nr:AP-1-like transcription factor YAP1 [Echria macrotheca]